MCICSESVFIDSQPVPVAQLERSKQAVSWLQQAAGIREVTHLAGILKDYYLCTWQILSSFVLSVELYYSKQYMLVIYTSYYI